MLFNSIAFFVFFLLVTTLYFLVPCSLRWRVLLLSSGIFYAWFIPCYIFILALLIGIGYATGILIEQARLKGKETRRYLLTGVAATCTALFFFKYLDFFNANMARVVQLFGGNYAAKTRLIVPLGISFYTFRSLSYIIEVHRGRQKAERHPGFYALNVMFYPLLAAGPLERPHHLLPQLRERHAVEYSRIADGLKMMAWGMFKKVVIADRLALLADRVYGNIAGYQGPELLIAAVFFTIQIYCDFSGYSDIAMGAAQVMGFKLMKNFDCPFFSQSLGEFWRRWHMSFFSWMKDYIYRPLRAHRVWRGSPVLCVVLVCLLAGFWYGPSWATVLGGGISGCFLLIQNAVYKKTGLNKKSGVFSYLKIALTFASVAFIGIFFRARSVPDALLFIKRLPMGWGWGTPWLAATDARLGFGHPYLVVSLVLIILHWLIEAMQRYPYPKSMFSEYPLLIRWSCYFLLIGVIICLGEHGQNQFIYFRF